MIPTGVGVSFIKARTVLLNSQYLLSPLNSGGQTKMDVVKFTDPQAPSSAAGLAQKQQLSSETVTIKELPATQTTTVHEPSKPAPEQAPVKPGTEQSVSPVKPPPEQAPVKPGTEQSVSPVKQSTEPPCGDSQKFEDLSESSQSKSENNTEPVLEQSVPKLECHVIIGEKDMADPAQESSASLSQHTANNLTTPVAVKQAWSDEQTPGEERSSGVSNKPEDRSGSILVEDIEQESEGSSKHISKTINSEDVFSTPTAPSPTVSDGYIACHVTPFIH